MSALDFIVMEQKVTCDLKGFQTELHQIVLFQLILVIRVKVL